MPTSGTVGGWIAANRVRGACALALLGIALSAGAPNPAPPDVAGLPPNILIVLTDDQTVDTLPSSVGAPPMPWLQAQIQDPDQPWVRFANAFLETPLCCPSRASILTGLSSQHTGVETNDDASELDESSTIATWLDDAGYTTGLFGKYLNDFPWDRGPYVPAGWDRFVAKRNQELATTYYGFGVVDQGVPQYVAPSPDGYATEYLADQATSFLRAAPAGRPWFLLFSPPAPHAPWTPAPADVGAFDGQPVPVASVRSMNDVRGKPAWVHLLPRVQPAQRDRFREQERSARETLLAVDRTMEALVAQIEARGELGRTIIVFLTDNGYAFGEHRWTGKRCPYEPCVRTPMVIRSPWASHSVVDDPVLNLDLVPTLLDLVRASVPVADPLVDGVSLRPFLDRRSSDPPPHRAGVVLRYTGDAQVPSWSEVRTGHLAYIETDAGARELYDLTGTIGRPDPQELRNVIADPRYGGAVTELAALLDPLVQAAPHR